MGRIIWWLRRDLRLKDNNTLRQAAHDGDGIIPVFILDPVLMENPDLASARRQFLFDSLADLDARMRERGGRLIVRRGNPERELTRLAHETRAEAVYHHLDVTPYARRRDERVAKTLGRMGIRVECFHDLYLAAPHEVLKPDGEPYTVFTPYRRRFEQVVAASACRRLRIRLNTPALPPPLDLAGLTPTRDNRFQPGGETEARRLWHRFLKAKDGLNSYVRTRNDLAPDATSHLSPHLHLGTISVRELFRTAKQIRNDSNASSVDAWIGELVWRDFYAQVLWHYPHAARNSFRPAFADLTWENDEKLFAAWCQGRTGYPVVDAAMRQLNATGWMHNRARMTVASFLTKDLLIDWRWGERYFMQHLIDGDMASNNGGWQWAAGTGTDAQPYFRIFNPVSQGKRYDPRGDYVRHWIPELSQVPLRHIHSPWTGPDGPPTGYPDPVVDHAAQRRRALDLFRRRS